MWVYRVFWAKIETKPQKKIHKRLKQSLFFFLFIYLLLLLFRQRKTKEKTYLLFYFILFEKTTYYYLFYYLFSRTKLGVGSDIYENICTTISSGPRITKTYTLTA